MKNYFFCHHASDVLVHALDPIADELGVAIQTFTDCGTGHPVSAANALIRLWLTAGQDSRPTDLAAALESGLEIAQHAFSPVDAQAQATYRRLVLHQLAANHQRLPQAWLETITQKLGPASHDGDFLNQVAAIVTQFRTNVIEPQPADYESAPPPSAPVRDSPELGR
jgi:hypothetical protein